MNSPVIEFIQYTDPYCTWCWGSEPMIRKIVEVYGDQVKLRYVVGGLVRDIRQFSDLHNHIGGREWYRSVAAHWLEASNQHGMPVDESIFLELKDELFSTYPASIAFKAAQFQDEELANKYLRRLREAASAECQVIQRVEVQIRLAEEVGLDDHKLSVAIESGRAAQAFAADLEECRRAGVSGFPTFLARNIATGKELGFGGFRRYREVSETLRRLGGAELIARDIATDDAALVAFMAKYAKVAPKELSEVFGLTAAECQARVEALVSRGLVRKSIVGNGYFVTLS